MEYTGRYLVLNRDPADSGLPKLLRDRAGLRIASASDFPRGTMDGSSLAGADGVYFETLGIAVTSSAPDQAEALTRGVPDKLIIERERVVHAISAPPRDFAPMEAPRRADPEFGTLAFSDLVCSLTAAGVSPSDAVRIAASIDETRETWGLQLTRVTGSSRSGRGVKVAVLDTGFDAQHPDFAGRVIVTRSFIEGETVMDGHGHGTHCIGTALGSLQPRALPRFGIATGGEIHAGKVIADSGRGSDGAVLAGMNWAIAGGCRVVSMSLGTATQAGDTYSMVFEEAAKRALLANCLIIAAAGNESRRKENRINPVGHPANCPSIMAVGAVDSDLKIAYFSTRGMEKDGGQVDIVGPGVDVYSTAPGGKHQMMSGTSMACPHVAGIAALYIEANPTTKARDIWQMMADNAKRLDLEPADMGAGLAQAPA